MDVSSKPEKIKMDALCELTAKIQQNPHPGNRACVSTVMFLVGLICHLLPCETETLLFLLSERQEETSANATII